VTATVSTAEGISSNGQDQRRPGESWTVPAREDFIRLASPFRDELLAHCYRMLGSVHDAEDQVQETFIRGWRSYGDFQGQSTLRTWLYRIATNACLRALENRSRRPLPSGLAGPSDNPDGSLAPALPEVSWLQPFPAALYGKQPQDPAATVASRHGMRLALIAALQYLPARQRAVLILRDVLGWRAAEVADLLGVSSPAINSLLQRARAQLRQVAPDEETIREPFDPDQRALLDRYARAFENADMSALTQLLRDDAVLEMPPIPTWFAGREVVSRFLASRVLVPANDWRMIATIANDQPAAAAYLRRKDGLHHAHGIAVLTIAGSRISRITVFNDPEIFDLFDLPQTISAVPTTHR
jgi:RNA polymerase sigma-70 factor, ECF subfamily